MKAIAESECFFDSNFWVSWALCVFKFLLHKYVLYVDSEKWKLVSRVSDSLRPHGLYSPWNSPGQNTGVGSLSLLQGIFPTQVFREHLYIFFFKFMEIFPMTYYIGSVFVNVQWAPASFIVGAWSSLCISKTYVDFAVIVFHF